MKNRDGFPARLTAACAAFVFLATSCSQPAQTGITEGRARALVGAVAGLISLIIGGLALARSAGLIGNGNGRNGAIASLTLGLIGVVLSLVHLGNSPGGFGTGGGRAGAIVGLVLGLIAICLGGLTLARSRRSRNPD